MNAIPATVYDLTSTHVRRTPRLDLGSVTMAPRRE